MGTPALANYCITSTLLFNLGATRYCVSRYVSSCYLQLKIAFVLFVVLLGCVWPHAFALAAQDNIPANVSFRHIKNKTLSEIGEVVDALKDDDGYMWFAGSGGLARFDGQNVKLFLPKEGGADQLPSNFTMKLYKDGQGRLWVGTLKGISLFDPSLEKFHTTRIVEEDDKETGSEAGIFGIASSKEANTLWLALGTKKFAKLNTETRQIAYQHFKEIEFGTALDIIEDQHGEVWIATMEGLFRLNPEKQEHTVYKHKNGVESSLTSDRISRLFIDSEQTLWVGTMDGLNRYVPASDSFVRYQHDADDVRSIGGKYIRGISQDSRGRLWFAVDGGGLNLFRPKTDDFHIYRAEDNDASSLQTNNMRGIYISPEDDVWVYFFPGGVSVLNKMALPFKTYQSGDDSASLSNSTVNAVEFSGDHDLWVGTEGGLNHIDLRNDVVKRYSHDANDLTSISTNAVISLKNDSRNRLWIGTWEGGLNLFSKSEKTFNRFRHIQGNNKSLCNNQVWDIYEKSPEKLWLGTQVGLCQFHINSNESDRINDAVKEYFGFIWSVNLFNDNAILVGALNRAGFVNTEREQILTLPNVTELQELVGYIINDTEVLEKTTWISTDRGVFEVDKNLNQAKRLIFPEGHENKAISTLVADTQGNIWLGSGSGIFRFNKQASQFVLLTEKHGLPGSRFERDASLRLPDGRIVIGGADGLVIFDPKEIVADNDNAQVILTRLTVLNRDVSIGGKGATISRAINKAKEIHLRYDQSMFTLHFTALDFQLPTSYQFSYRLKGFDENWIHIGERRMATYTNLDPGSYVFEVKAKNGQGIFSPNFASINITIDPPWWLTWWAYVLYVLSGISVLLFVLSYFWNQQKAERERKLNEKLKEVDKMKDEFLANTSHELRTPLHGIIGLSELLLNDDENNFSNESYESLQLIRASSKRLSALINDILDFSKLRNKNIELSLGVVDLHELIDQVVALTSPLFADKDLRLENNIPDSFPYVIADKNRLTQVMHNLIGNAVKFTEQGRISITAAEVNGKAMVSVIDTGIGIPKEKLGSIFAHFEQVDGSIERKYGGTGLGLSITKKLIELHGGTIRVESEIGQGTEFYFDLKIAKEGEINNLVLPSVTDQPSTLSDDVGKPKPDTTKKATKDNKKSLLTHSKHAGKADAGPKAEANIAVASSFRVVIVDDEMVNRRVLSDHLKKNGYETVEYSSGDQFLQSEFEDGLEKLDIILLDVMMPGKSGYEVCKEIRTKLAPEQLPVVFLTARSEDSDIEMGYTVGGNDYLRKPFSKEELLHRMRLHLSLLDVNRTMEEKVKRRTAQLESSNNSLKESKDKLIKMQTQLVQSEKMSSLGMLLSGVGHEINNPVNFINLAAGTLGADLKEFKEFILELAEEADEDIIQSFENRFSELSETLATISDGVSRVNGVVDNLRTFSRSGNGSAQAQSLIGGLDSTINLVKANYKNDVDIITEYSCDLPIFCVLAELNQVFMNLMVNACQAMMDSETVNPKHELRISTMQEDQHMVIRFADTGPGMNEDLQVKIFDPFFSTKTEGEGTGLGLSISYEIVHRYGGEISVSSQLGEGSIFTLRFPIAKNA